MSATPASAREQLASPGIDHAGLSHGDAVTITAVNTCGRYPAPG
jgi:hypothetical protein